MIPKSSYRNDYSLRECIALIVNPGDAISYVYQQKMNENNLHSIFFLYSLRLRSLFTGDKHESQD